MSSDKIIKGLFFVFSIFILLLVLMRLVHLQVIEGNRYKRFVESQINSSLTVSKNRGYIYDSEGSVLVSNAMSASLFAYGKNINNMNNFTNGLKKGGITLSSKTKNSLAKKDGFTWIERRIDINDARKLVKDVRGLEYFKEEARFYPEGNVMASLIGFTGSDNEGRAGLEYMLDDELSGEKAVIASLRDSHGRLILFEDKTDLLNPDSEVHLTISSRTQAAAEHLLRAGAEKYGARNGTAIAIDIETGKILLSADVASFDPKNYAKYPQSTWKNIALSYVYEPGSIFKAVTYSYLYDNDKLDLSRTVDTTKKVKIGKYTYSDTKDYGVLSIEEVFTHSSNIGIAHLMKDEKHETFHNFLETAGFGAKTGIYGLPEESGRLKPASQWSGTSSVSIAIGYEVLVTPLQIARFYAAIANGGEMITPRAVESVKAGGVNQEITQDVVRIMKKETADYMLGLMRRTVEDGTGSNARTKIVNIAGKTGTSAIYDAKLGDYSKQQYSASFAGVFPSDDPKVAMIVMYEAPRSSIYGGSTAAMVFRQIAEYIAVERKYFEPQLRVAYEN